MNSRNRVITALNNRKPDRPPFFLEFTAPVYEVFKQQTGKEDVESHFDTDIRTIRFHPTQKKQDFSHYVDASSIDEINEWGIGHIKGSGYQHFVDMFHPLEKVSTVEEILEYPWPDTAAEYRVAGLEEKVNDYHQKGYAVRIAPPFYGGTIFETSWALRGFEQLLMDLGINEELAMALLDKVTGLSIQSAMLAASTGADILVLGDDVGTQKAMLMSPNLWRFWFKPRLAEVIKAAKSVNPNLFAFYHSCGYIMPIIEDLIEIGVDIINPIQPESMDIKEIRDRFAGRVAFWGGVGTQTVMPFGTPEDVENAVKRLCDVLGERGGLVVAPTHVLEPEVPWQNIMAFHKAVLNYLY